MTALSLPLRSGGQRFQTQFGENVFDVSILYRDAEIGGGWYMDMSLTDGSASLLGMPLVEGADLLGQYQYLGWGHLWVLVDGGDIDITTYEGMSENVSLIWSDET